MAGMGAEDTASEHGYLDNLYFEYLRKPRRLTFFAGIDLGAQDLSSFPQELSWTRTQILCVRTQFL